MQWQILASLLILQPMPLKNLTRSLFETYLPLIAVEGSLSKFVQYVLSSHGLLCEPLDPPRFHPAPLYDLLILQIIEMK